MKKENLERVEESAAPKETIKRPRTFNEVFWPIGRKEHRCEYCYWRIPEGERHAHFIGMFEDEFQNWRMHEECYADFRASGEDCFSCGDANPPERIKAIYKPSEIANAKS